MSKDKDNKKKGEFFGQGIGFFLSPDWIVDDELRKLLKLPEIDYKEKLILINFCRRFDKKGSCFPSYEKIAKDIDLSRSTVKRGMKSLREKGLVVSEIRRRADGTMKSCIYRLIKVPDRPFDIKGSDSTHPKGQTDPPYSVEGNTEIQEVQQQERDSVVVSLVNFGVAEEVALDISSKHEKDFILYQLQIAKMKGDTLDNPAGWLVEAIRKNWQLKRERKTKQLFRIWKEPGKLLRALPEKCPDSTEAAYWFAADNTGRFYIAFYQIKKWEDTGHAPRIDVDKITKLPAEPVGQAIFINGLKTEIDLSNGVPF